METRLESQSPLKLSDGLLQAALLLPNKRQIEVGFRKRGLCTKDGGESGRCFLKPAFAHCLRGGVKLGFNARIALHGHCDRREERQKSG